MNAPTGWGGGMTYRQWSKWKRRRVHARWWVADRIHGLAYRIGGDA